MVARLRVGDKVIVNSGNHKGIVGALVAFSPDRGRVSVEGLPPLKRHRKALPGQTHGEIVELPRFVHASNVCPVDKNGRPSRVKVEKSGKKATRMLVSSGEQLPTT